jgi:sporulation protein YlmC with PRC-barrel domain
MLQNIKNFYGKSLGASDGEIGHVKDFYFDDDSWAVRYVVADTGTWLAGRLVLLSPHAFSRFDQGAARVHANLTRRQIEKGPPIGSHLPVSRQYEEEYYSYYGLPEYWQGGQMWGMGGFPVVVPPAAKVEAKNRARERAGEAHLRSARAVTGYHIQTVDGAIGDVSDFMLDSESWAIRDLVVEAGHWFSGKEILIPTGKVERISYEDSTVFVSLTKADIERTGENEVVQAGGMVSGAADFFD